MESLRLDVLVNSMCHTGTPIAHFVRNGEPLWLDMSLRDKKTGRMTVIYYTEKYRLPLIIQTQFTARRSAHKISDICHITDADMTEPAAVDMQYKNRYIFTYFSLLNTNRTQQQP